MRSQVEEKKSELSLVSFVLDGVNWVWETQAFPFSKNKIKSCSIYLLLFILIFSFFVHTRLSSNYMCIYMLLLFLLIFFFFLVFN